MTLETQITNAIARGKEVSLEWGSNFLLKTKYGEDLGCEENKLVLLNWWKEVLEDYKTENFGDNGSITPDYECLTLEQALLLVSKINSLEC